jgi:hypothetical protein
MREAISQAAAQWPGQQPDGGARSEHETDTAGMQAIVLQQARQKRRGYAKRGKQGCVKCQEGLQARARLHVRRCL